MINIPGDRRDEDIREMGALATRYFDEIVFREDPARRGRKPGEIVELLVEGALAEGFSEAHIRRVMNEEDAAPVCLEMARPGDLVVLTPTEVEAMWQQVLDFRVSPETRLEAEIERRTDSTGTWQRSA
jgi:cyanophycin synthetase